MNQTTTASGQSYQNQQVMRGAQSPRNEQFQGLQGVETAREPRIPSAQTYLDGQIIQLLKTAEELATRLHPVLRNEVDLCPSEKGCMQTPPPVTVYDKITASAQLVSAANNRLQELVRTLEL